MGDMILLSEASEVEVPDHDHRDVVDLEELQGGLPVVDHRHGVGSPRRCVKSGPDRGRVDRRSGDDRRPPG